MADRWMIRGTQFGNCNCAWGCPCQFNAPTTHGYCEAVEAGHIEEGYFNETRLDGLNFVLLVQWPGEIADGDGTEQAIIDDRADEAQRETLRKILHGESTAPGATHFFVFNSTMSKVLETLHAPISLEIDVEARRASLSVPRLIELQVTPIVDPKSGEEFRVGIQLPRGFQWTSAEVGTGTAKVEAGIQLNLQNGHTHLAALHMNQDGVIR